MSYSLLSDSRRQTESCADFVSCFFSASPRSLPFVCRSQPSSRGAILRCLLPFLSTIYSDPIMPGSQLHVYFPASREGSDSDLTSDDDHLRCKAASLGVHRAYSSGHQGQTPPYTGLSIPLQPLPPVVTLPDPRRSLERQSVQGGSTGGEPGATQPGHHAGQVTHGTQRARPGISRLLRLIYGRLTQPRPLHTVRPV